MVRLSVIGHSVSVIPRPINQGCFANFHEIRLLKRTNENDKNFHLIKSYYKILKNGFRSKLIVTSSASLGQ